MNKFKPIKKILITGSNGLLGQKLTRLIQKEGVFEPVATSRGENRNPDFTGTYHNLDISDEAQVLRMVEAVRPDYIIHTAAMTNVDACEEDKEGCWKANVTAVENLVKACEKTGAFLVHVSTDFIFDGTAGPYKEEDAPNPVSYYGESKLAAEAVIQKSTIDWAIARTVLVFGINPGMSRSNIILWVKNSLEQGKPLQIVNDQWRTPTLAEDLAMGCYLIAKKNAKGIFNISGEELLTPYDMAMKTARYFNLDASLITETDGSKFQQKAKRPPKTGFILDKAREVLNYQPHSFDEGLELLATQLSES